MKKSLFDFVKIKVYRYSPESCKVFFNGHLQNLSYEDAHNIGYIAITKGYDKAMQEIKRMIRKYLNKQYNYKRLAIRTNEQNEYIYLVNYHNININNIHERLTNYKLLKETYNNNQINITVQQGKMTSYGHFEKPEQIKIDKPVLLNRILYV